MNAVSGSIATPTPARAPLWRICLSEARWEFTKLVRMPAFAIPSMAFPLGFYVLFALVLPGRWGELDKSLYLLATYGVFGMMGPALFGFGVGVANEREQGWLDLKRVSPMPMGAYFFAKIAMAMAFALIILALLTGAALVAGLRIGVAQWLGLAAILLLGTLPFCALGLAIGSAVRAQAAVAIVNLVYLPMSLLSGLWLPVEVFPRWMQAFAAWLPPYPLARMALDAVGIGQAQWLLGAAQLAAYAIVFLLLAGWLQRRGGLRQD